jgi:hypothetical protein
MGTSFWSGSSVICSRTDRICRPSRYVQMTSTRHLICVHRLRKAWGKKGAIDFNWNKQQPVVAAMGFR